MAPKGQKRNAAESKKAGAAKKARAEAECATVEDPAMSAIIDTIETDDSLSQNCRNMLVAGIRGSLSIPANERHDAQSMVVRMVEEVMVANQTSLQDGLDKATVTVSKLEELKSDLTTRLAETEADLAQKRKLVDDTTEANASAEEKVAAAKEVLAAAEAAQKAGDLVVKEKQQNKELIENTINTDLKAVLEGEDGSRSCNALLTVISPLQFDESLIKALPGTCVKAPAERGSFDSMVLNQLEASLKDTLAEFSKAVDNEAIAVKERSDTVQTATAAVDEAVANQAQAEEKQSAAEAARLEASTEAASIKAVLAGHEDNQSEASEVREALAQALEAFQNTTRGPFENLKNMTTHAADPEPVVTETPAVEMEVSADAVADSEPKVTSEDTTENNVETKVASPEAKATNLDTIVDASVVTAAGA